MKMIESYYMKFVLFGLPCLWLLGIHVLDVARVMLAVLIVMNISKYYNSNKESAKLNEPSSDSWDKGRVFLIFILAAVFSEIYFGNVAKVYLGDHGKDTAIFAQVSGNFNKYLNFGVSLNRNTYRSFLADHLSPLLGGVFSATRLGLNPAVALITFQMISIGLGILAIYLLMRYYKSPKGLALLISLIWLCLGDVRSQLYWGIQVEYIATGFVLLSIYFWNKNSVAYSIIAAFIAILCKETLLLWAGVFAFTCVLRGYIDKGTLLRRTHLMYAFFGLFCAVIFYLFVYQHQLFFQKKYDYSARINLEQILSFKILFYKFLYIAHFFIPVFFLRIQKREFLFSILPVVPFFMITLVSNFEDMWSFNRQYVLFPTTIVYISAVQAALKNGNINHSFKLNQLSCLMALAFSTGTHKPLTSITKYLNSSNLLQVEQLEKLPSNAAVFVSNSAALFLSQHQFLYFIHEVKNDFVADKNAGKIYIVVKKEEAGSIPEWLQNKTVPCFPSSIWEIRCPST